MNRACYQSSLQQLHAAVLGDLETLVQHNNGWNAANEGEMIPQIHEVAQRVATQHQLSQRQKGDILRFLNIETACLFDRYREGHRGAAVWQYPRPRKYCPFCGFASVTDVPPALVWLRARLRHLRQVFLKWSLPGRYRPLDDEEKQLECNTCDTTFPAYLLYL